MDWKILNIKNSYLEKISRAKSLNELDEIYLTLFGKSGEITLLPKNFSELSKEDLSKIGPLFNRVKTELEKAIDDRREKVRESVYKQLKDEELELEEGSIKKRKGHLHPITALNEEIANLGKKIGFQQFSAPHIDSDYYNFEGLNIPYGHPARDLWDTLYIDHPEKYGFKEGQLLLRTHTSNAQIRIMKELKLPIRIMVIDRLFRFENLDARHEHTFDQFEIVYVDKGVSMANLQYLSEYFLKHIFGKDIKVRLRPKYYPFVEPGAGVDGECIFCKGKGCKICGGVGWLELAGAGMIHPFVLNMGGIDPEKYSGLAWGFGPFRMAMLKYGVEDIRLFNSGDLRFLERF
ncbi:phenylalanine--tRNA ligase subunit alpha [Candidatus Daviesbacteria bacterium]|nr:phenylalanine--tRNA ligase subunit alpha [Candidatus Daviesbacteria bacterium]